MNRFIRKTFLALMASVFGAGSSHAATGPVDPTRGNPSQDRRDTGETKLAQTIYDIDQFLDLYSQGAPAVRPQRQRKVQPAPQRTIQRAAPPRPAPRTAPRQAREY